MQTVRLVLGLGNPGAEYVGTRHNVGFEVVDCLANRWGCVFRPKARFAAEVAEHGAVWLAKPQTYMNLSGRSVAALLGWWKLSPSEMLVVMDDADLPLGRIKVLASGGSGGHNGLRSIIEALGGTESFPRVRLGIGRQSAPGAGDLSEHVLGRFTDAERPVARAMIERAAAAVETVLTHGLARAMNEFNRKVSEGVTG
ncbi:MAG: aminoacyl-tRNA hydrolase [Verrucomicrobiae bacterium]|nr:aminoacyl-tRNA hydrolase [Verrucomicrobiae bacterium]